MLGEDEALDGVGQSVAFFASQFRASEHDAVRKRLHDQRERDCEFSSPVASAVHHSGLHRVASQLSGMVAANASLISYLYVFRVSALIFAACLPLLIFLRQTSTAIES